MTVMLCDGAELARSVPDATTVYVPAMLRVRSEKVATPSTACSVSVPPNVPFPVLSATSIVTLPL